PPCPFLPRLSVPFFRRFMALSTSLPALREYLAIAMSPMDAPFRTRARMARYNRSGTVHPPWWFHQRRSRMPAPEEAKRVAEKLTGGKRPGREALPRLVRARKPNLFCFKDDGETPNHPKWPLVMYRSPVNVRGNFDCAAIFEDLFASNGWADSWCDG